MAIKFKIIMTNQWLYSLIALGFLLALGVGVLAYKSGLPPSVMGHSADEIEGIPPTILVRHSLTSNIPACPDGWKKLWDGYSFMGGYIGNDESAQGLGDPGACLETFTTYPFTETSSPNGGEYIRATHLTVWLANEKALAEAYGESLQILDWDKMQQYASRCVVCEKPATILVRHSFLPTPPACPDGWKKLWDGYSYLGTILDNYYSEGESLGGTGSCLEISGVPPIPIKCTSPGGCSFHATNNPHAGGGPWSLGVFLSNNQTLSFGFEAKLYLYTSKCVVCSK